MTALLCPNSFDSLFFLSKRPQEMKCIFLLCEIIAFQWWLQHRYIHCLLWRVMHPSYVTMIKLTTVLLKVSCGQTRTFYIQTDSYLLTRFNFHPDMHHLNMVTLLAKISIIANILVSWMAQRLQELRWAFSVSANASLSFTSVQPDLYALEHETEVEWRIVSTTD